MTDSTKYKLDSRVEVAFLYLKDHCSINDTVLKRKFIRTETESVVLICGADNGTYASIGIDKEDRLRIYMQDPKVYRWGKLEGFTDDEIYEKLEDELVKETTLLELARSLVR
jgi:hypothetical protein